MENFVLEQDKRNAINGSNNLPILIDVLIGKMVVEYHSLLKLVQITFSVTKSVKPKMVL